MGARVHPTCSLTNNIFGASHCQPQYYVLFLRDAVYCSLGIRHDECSTFRSAPKIGVCAAQATDHCARQIRSKMFVCTARILKIRATVASLRLDSVAAAGFGVSRTQMTEEIQAEKVKVNWKDAKNASQNVKAGDIISFRGRGRVEVVEITGQTKKGRRGVLLKR